MFIADVLHACNSSNLLSILCSLLAICPVIVARMVGKLQKHVGGFANLWLFFPGEVYRHVAARSMLHFQF